MSNGSNDHVPRGTTAQRIQCSQWTKRDKQWVPHRVGLARHTAHTVLATTQSDFGALFYFLCRRGWESRGPTGNASTQPTAPSMKHAWPIHLRRHRCDGPYPMATRHRQETPDFLSGVGPRGLPSLTWTIAKCRLDGALKCFSWHGDPAEHPGSSSSISSERMLQTSPVLRALEVFAGTRRCRCSRTWRSHRWKP